MKLLILSPHIDDGFLSLGGFIAKYSGLHDLKILDIFSFDPWVLEYYEAGNKLENISVRKNEELTNAKKCGVKIDFLDYPAGWKERGYLNWQAKIDRDRDKQVMDEVSNYIGNLSRIFDLIFSPLGIGGHVDHKLVREIVSNQLTKSKVYYYEDLPYALKKSFFKYTEIFQENQELSSYVLKLDKEELKKKKVFVKNYKSQLTKEEMELIMKYSEGKSEHKISKVPSEIIWTHKDNIEFLKGL